MTDFVPTKSMLAKKIQLFSKVEKHIQRSRKQVSGLSEEDNIIKKYSNQIHTKSNKYSPSDVTFKKAASFFRHLTSISRQNDVNYKCRTSFYNEVMLIDVILIPDYKVYKKSSKNLHICEKNWINLSAFRSWLKRVSCCLLCGWS